MCALDVLQHASSRATNGRAIDKNIENKKGTNED